jgi:hypothetical protein
MICILEAGSPDRVCNDNRHWRSSSRTFQLTMMMETTVSKV